MAKASLTNMIRELAYDMIDKHGNFRPIPIGSTGKRNLSEDRIKLFRDILYLFRESSMLSDESKLYLFDVDIKLKTVNSEINEKRKKSGLPELSQSTTQSKIFYDKNKIVSCLGEDFIKNIKYLSNNSVKIAEYKEKVLKLYSEYFGNNKLRAGLLLTLDGSKVSSSLSDGEFDEFLAMIAPYTVNQKKYIEDSLEDNQVGYFNYLLSTPNLSGKDLDNLNRLKLCLEPND